MLNLQDFQARLTLMRLLELRKVVKELMPDHDGNGGSIWSWEVLKPELLPETPWLQENLTANNGIIRL